MPNVDRSWYTNTQYGANYFNFVTKELPEVCRHNFKVMSDKREDNIVAGLSMGGYGAIKLALSCPEQYAYCISLSGSLDITRKGRPYSIDEWRSIFGFDMHTPLELEGSEHDLFWLTEKNKKDGLPFPKLYMWCGTEDTLIKSNIEYHELLTRLGIEHTFETSEGSHTWRWWDLHILPALNYILND
jgi:S-formylglutathione hydrolase FrmB